MLLPAELAQIERDLKEMILGPDGTDVTITWTAVVSGTADPIYGDGQTTTTGTTTARALIKVFREKEVDKRGYAEVMAGDALFIFMDSVALEGKKDVLFTASGGRWRPQVETPADVIRYAAMLPSGLQGIQCVFARYAKDAA